MSAPRIVATAIVSAIDNLFACPKTMAAVDRLAEGFSSTDAMLEYLWKYPDALGWGSVLGFEYSQSKQTALFTVTGKTWREWTDLA